MHTLIKRLFIILSLPMLLGGCMHNNGDIGFWFGTWHVTDITIDGTPDADYADNLFFKFQSSVCDMIVVSTTEMHSAGEYYSSWSEQDGCLLLDFTYHSDIVGGAYAPPSITPFKNGEVNTLQINKINNRNIELTYFSTEENATYTFTLKKE